MHNIAYLTAGAINASGARPHPLVNHLTNIMPLVVFALINIFYSAQTLAQDVVLALRPDSIQFEQISQGIIEAVGGEMQIVDMVVDPAKDERLIFDWITLNRPNAIVLMDNHGVNTYARYQNRKNIKNYPPSIIVSTLLADRLVSQINNSTAVLYEVPAITSLVDLRKMMVNQPIQTVGTIFRSSYKQIFLTQNNFAKLEKINLVGVEVPDNASAKTLKKALRKLKNLKTDALWIMNDPALMKKDDLTQAWIPELKRYDRPVVVGIRTLIKTEFSFGDYAIYPDHYEMGIQVGDKLFDLQDNDWQLSTEETIQPISIRKEINIHRLDQKGISYQRAYLNEFERVIKE